MQLRIKSAAPKAVAASFVVMLGFPSVASPAQASTGGVSAVLATSTTSSRLPVGHSAVIPRAAHDLGPYLPTAPLKLDFVLVPRNPEGLQSFISSLYNPTSPLYHHFLPAGEFGPLFGASQSTITTVSGGLEALGLHPGPINSDGLVIPVTTTVGAAERALDITIHNYRLASGKVAFANTSPPLVPSLLATQLTAVVGLSDLYTPKPQLTSHVALPSGTAPTTPVRWSSATPTPHVTSAVTSCSAATGAGGYSASQIASAYGFDSGAYAKGLLGQGETIALYELEPFAPSDLASFESCYGINTPVNVTTVDGGAGFGPGSGEAILDIENTVELAPDATVDVYESPNDGGAGPLDGYVDIADQDTAEVVSTSWGICEPLLGSAAANAEEYVFMQMATQGQTIFAASGDSGSEDCFSGPGTPTGLAVDDPGSDPYVTSVGGTTLHISATGTRSSESVWNNGYLSGAGAGGGGISTLWTMPSWQNGPGVIEAFSTGTACGAPKGQYCREVPDVSANANPYDGYDVYYLHNWTAEGGTSGAAPVWAAVTALADQACGATKPAAAAGFVNPALYSHAADMFDVTSGNNDYTGTNGGLYPAGVGYDMASGLGTPTAALFTPGVLCDASTGPVKPAQPTPTGHGYWLVGSDGGVFSFGDASYYGSVPGDNIHVNNIIAAIPTPTGL